MKRDFFLMRIGSIVQREDGVKFRILLADKRLVEVQNIETGKKKIELKEILQKNYSLVE